MVRATFDACERGTGIADPATRGHLRRVPPGRSPCAAFLGGALEHELQLEGRTVRHGQNGSGSRLGYAIVGKSDLG